MGTIRRLYETAGWAIIIAAVVASIGHSAPESADGIWMVKLRSIRQLAMARRRPAAVQGTVLKQGVGPTLRAAALPAPKPGETSIDLAAAFNKHIKSKLTFQANGWNIWASAGLNPDNPDGDYLILQVEDKAAIVFDIRSVITLTEQLRAFAVNGVPMVLVGDAVVKWGNPERDSTLAVMKNVGSFTEPKAGDALLKPFTMAEFRKALWDAGTPVMAGGEEIRFYYGDQVNKGEKRLQTGPGKGFAFIRKIGDEKYSKAVLLNEDKLPVGGSVTLSLAKDMVLRLVRDDQNVLKVTKENTK